MLLQIFGCYRKPFVLKAIAADAGVDEFAIDEHPVAVEDEKTRKSPFEPVTQGSPSGSSHQDLGHVAARAFDTIPSADQSAVITSEHILPAA